MAQTTIDGVARNAVVIITVIAVGAALFWLRGILTPLALAVFLAVMIDGFARALAEKTPNFPKAAALPTAIVLTILLLVLLAVVIADNAAGFANQLITYTPKLEALIGRAADALGLEAPPSLAQLIREANPAQYATTIAQGFQGVLTDTFFVLIYLAFIIASRRGFRKKIVALFPHGKERDEAMASFVRIRDGVEQYLWVQTVTGLMIAGGSLLVMWAVGLDNALFWAFLIFLASYIPIIGGVIGVALPPLFALVQFDGFVQAAILAAALQTIQFVVGNVIQPKMQGDSLNIDPVVVLLSLALWGLVWGMPGMFLSTPLTVAAMVILAQFQGTRWIAILLSANGEPAGDPHRHRGGKPPASRPAATAKSSSARSAKSSPKSPSDGK
jgi:predicted PurR-regulated permease PerM